MLKSIAATRAFSSTASNKFAKIQLLGRIGNITYKETKDNRPFLNYSLAVDRYAPNDAPEGKLTVTDWYSLSVFDDKQVAFFQNHLDKGAQIYAEADIKQKTVQDEAGEKLVYTTMYQTRYEVIRFPKKKEPTAE
ncbi:hypothetical protein HF325_004533 [Metschnikowia pulcherrima]|uniref:Single-stranded DNA-binding protein n=1 Tax=Metschnikowia pulcherrima TaxID=27326 RepID=A0A8H7GNK4_9ASCO|nr:hypothetical protein HF325_004533 [Metschnikowia pulcherrima]